MALGKQVKTWDDFSKRLKEENVKIPSGLKVHVFKTKSPAGLVQHIKKAHGGRISLKEAIDLTRKIKKIRDPRTLDQFLKKQGYNPSQRDKLLYEKLSSSEVKKMVWKITKTYKTTEKRKSELKKLGLKPEEINKILRASRQLVVADDLKDKDMSALKDLGIGYDAKKKRLATILGDKVRKVLSGSGLFGQGGGKVAAGQTNQQSTLAGEKKGGLATIGEATGITGGFETSSGEKFGKDKDEEDNKRGSFKNIGTYRPM